MLFNSIEFAIFMPIVFLVYWFVFNKNLKLQNIFLLAVSYLFYGWWDWRFLSLIIFSSLVDYGVSYFLDKNQKKNQRKLLLLVSILVNLGFLGFFKYFNFFVESFQDAFLLFGKKINVSTLHIILPVGISFYTFQTLSYTIDVYKRKLKPAKDAVSFFAFVSFFPQLVAGPIERATNLLPQFYEKRKFDYENASDGMRQILWGLFKKVVIADNSAILANQIFNNYTHFSGLELIIGAMFFAFQIYGDFSGYSDIAIGSARLLGFDLKQNFAFPYFSRDIAEFWRRWHISLSTWFRDYLYIPLGGSKGGTFMKIRNTFAIFIVSGFWHGANWTFMFWGFLNALYFLPLLLSNKNRKNLGAVAENRLFPTLKELFQITSTFFLTILAWIFFRSDNLSSAFDYIYRIFTKFSFDLSSANIKMWFVGILIFFFIVEWLHRSKQYGLDISTNKNSPFLRWVFYILITYGILFFGAEQQNFIYFQF